MPAVRQRALPPAQHHTVAAVGWQRNESFRLEAATLCVETALFDAVGTTARWAEYARLFPPLLQE